MLCEASQRLLKLEQNKNEQSYSALGRKTQKLQAKNRLQMFFGNRSEKEKTVAFLHFKN